MGYSELLQCIYALRYPIFLAKLENMQLNERSIAISMVLQLHPICRTYDVRFESERRSYMKESMKRRTGELAPLEFSIVYFPSGI